MGALSPAGSPLELQLPGVLNRTPLPIAVLQVGGTVGFMEEDFELDPEDDMASEAALPSSGRKVAVMVMVGVVVAFVMVIVFALAPKGAPVDGVLPADPAGYQAPEFNLPLLDGSGDLKLSSLKGKPVVVNFWASWCGPCQAEAATLAAGEKRWRDKGVVFIGVNSADQNEAAKEFEKKYGIEYPSVVDPDAKTAAQWRTTAYPETFFIDPSGRIVSKFISTIDEKSLDTSIEAILP